MTETRRSGTGRGCRKWIQARPAARTKQAAAAIQGTMLCRGCASTGGVSSSSRCPGAASWDPFHAALYQPPHAGRDRAQVGLLLDDRRQYLGKVLAREKAFDRHRGGGHPPTPATPLCVRVRTRRFEMVIQHDAASSRHLRPRSLTPRKYQNPDHHPYLSVPRPPQTRAAHFKRLYRK